VGFLILLFLALLFVGICSQDPSLAFWGLLLGGVGYLIFKAF